MRKFRFFSERDNLREGSSVKLPDFEAKHVKKSLRLQVGDPVYVFNGRREFLAKLTHVSRETVMAKIETEVSRIDEEDTRSISLFQGLSKQKSFEFVLEKATELGVDEISPFDSEYSVVKTGTSESKMERWEKIVFSSCKQSERISIPNITPPVTFKDAVEKASSEDYDRVLFFTLDREKNSKLTSISDVSIAEGETRVAIFIGPEGGFSPSEEKMAKDNGFELVSLFSGRADQPIILRSETAAIAALSIVKYLLSK